MSWKEISEREERMEGMETLRFLLMASFVPPLHRGDAMHVQDRAEALADPGS